MKEYDLTLQALAMRQLKYVKNYNDFKPGDFIQYAGQCWDEKETYAMLDTIMNGSWITAGSQVSSFQNKFSRKFNVKYSHMVNSGSSANLVMIAALKKYYGWNDKSEIIVSPVGFPTTIAPIVQNGLVPRFIDIEMDTLNFNTDLIFENINENTVAIFVSPVLGNPPNMDHILDLANQHGLVIIGDNCDSLGTRWNDELITDFYTTWSSSFYPAHHISTGEGGMVSSNNDEIINTVRSLSWWGRDCYCVGSNNMLPCGTCGNRFDKWIPEFDGIVDHKYVFTNMGYNLKPLDLQGAIGIEQLLKFDDLEYKRQFHANFIKHRIEKFLSNSVSNVLILDGATPSWFGIPMICKDQSTKERLVQHFETNHIQTRNYFSGNILLHPGYKHLDDYKKYPYANKALSHVFFIGCSPAYNDLVLNYIYGVIENAKDIR